MGALPRAWGLRPCRERCRLDGQPGGMIPAIAAGAATLGVDACRRVALNASVLICMGLRPSPVPCQLGAQSMQMPAVSGSCAARGHSSACMSPGTSSTGGCVSILVVVSGVQGCTQLASNGRHMWTAASGWWPSSRPLAALVPLRPLVLFSKLGQQPPGPCCRAAGICRSHVAGGLLTRQPHPLCAAFWTPLNRVPT